MTAAPYAVDNRRKFGRHLRDSIENELRHLLGEDLSDTEYRFTTWEELMPAAITGQVIPEFVYNGNLPRDLPPDRLEQIARMAAQPAVVSFSREDLTADYVLEPRHLVDFIKSQKHGNRLAAFTVAVDALARQGRQLPELPAPHMIRFVSKILTTQFPTVAIVRCERLHEENYIDHGADSLAEMLRERGVFAVWENDITQRGGTWARHLQLPFRLPDDDDDDEPEQEEPSNVIELPSTKGNGTGPDGSPKSSQRWQEAGKYVLQRMAEKRKPDGSPYFSAVDCAVVLHLLLYENQKSGQSWPAQSTIADELNMTVRGVRNVLKRLEEAGVIYRNPGKGWNANTRYRFAKRFRGAK